MTRFLRIFSGVILLALLSTVGIVCAAEANLSVSKTVNSTGPYAPGDDVEWVVTIRNNGPYDATNISLKEDISQLLGHQDITVKVGDGEYNSTTNAWKIPRLENATSASLTLVTNFSTAGEKTNKVNITVLDQTDPYPYDNHAEKMVIINAPLAVIHDTPLSVNLSIRPTTLNLKSRGVFTVFVSLNGISPETSADTMRKSRIDYDNSSLTCGEAELIRASVSNKDGGTLIAKFHRQDLMNVTNATGVMINCSGTISVNGQSVYVEGSDTIRVIGEKKGLAKIVSDVKKFLHLGKDEEEVNETADGAVAVPLNVDGLRNKGQEKKLTRISGDDPVTDSGDPQSDTTRGGKVKEVKNNGNNENLRKNDAGETGKGNNNPKRSDDESPGKSNGKKKT